ncbi:MAG: biotin--[acetyl-CoA-carboxylase] ligase [Dehalococcoidales bacterium]
MPAEEDILSAYSISNKLETNFIGKRVTVYPKLASTMEIAKIAASKKVPEGTLIIAEEQSAGKGRLDREWVSPQGCISLSLILYPDIKRLPSLIMVASVALMRTINKLTGLNAVIKWPNDILIKRKKVAGILIEGAIQHVNVSYVVIGVGLNANLNPKDYPEIEAIATSLSEEKGRYIERVGLIREFLTEFEKLYSLAAQSDLVYKEWRDNMDTIGKKVSAKSGNTSYKGKVKGVTEDGRLVIETSDGETINFTAGDVILIE